MNSVARIAVLWGGLWAAACLASNQPAASAAANPGATSPAAPVSAPAPAVPAASDAPPAAAASEAAPPAAPGPAASGALQRAGAASSPALSPAAPTASASRPPRKPPVPRSAASTPAPAAKPQGKASATPAPAPAAAPASLALPAPASSATAPLAAPAAAPRTGQPTPIFVLNSLDASVSVIDPLTWVEAQRLPTGKEPHHMYLTPDEKSLIIANALADSLTFIDPRTAEVQRVVRDIVDPYQLRFSPDMKWFVTAANRLNHVDIYRWNGKDLALAKRVATGKTPSHLWIDSKSSVIYATMQDSDELVAIDLATQALKWRVATGSLPADVFGTADDKFLLLGLTGGDGVEVFDVSGPAPRRVKKIPTGNGAHAFRSAGDKRHVFVSNRVANTISKINLQTLEAVATFAAPSGPDCMEVTPDGKLLMVTSRWAKKLTVIDLETQKIVRQVNVGKSPHGVWTLEHASRF